ncbi:MAG: hypothetical protein K8F91_10595, partial [Candidatus Obscuribacterales bacterium]|nr:hypothetical protein [Candidatus Obscuribacterales bacterium]
SKTKLFRLGWVVLVLIGILAGFLFVTRADQNEWPDFSQVAAANSPLAPQVVARAERDYGWRTGDIIPLEEFIKQMPGTRVDPNSLAIEGDFAIVEAPAIHFEDLEDGSRLIKVSLKLQSMSVSKQLMLKTQMLYRDLETGEDLLFAPPVFAPFTSMTWDGRDVIQDGDPQVDNFAHTLATTVLIIGGLIGAVFMFFLGRKLRQKSDAEHLGRGWLNRREIARQKFDAVWQRFENGDFDKRNYEELSAIVRELFHVQSKGFNEIALELGSGHPYLKHTQKILLICGEVIYRNRIMHGPEHFAIKKIFDQIVRP